jgi:hypothetical protein
MTDPTIWEDFERDLKSPRPLPEIMKNIPIIDPDPITGKPERLNVDWSNLATHYTEDMTPCNCSRPLRQADTGEMYCTDKPFEPKLWETRPDAVVHIAGVCLTVFGRFMRQRCDWCGIILLEYDLSRIAVPVDQPGPPPYWTAGSLVRVDGHVSAEILNPESVDGQTQLKSDSCVFDPDTQVK